MSSAQPKPSSRKRKSGSASVTGSGTSTPTTGEKKNRPKPRARQKAKAAKAKQEEEDALLAASNFAGSPDEDDDDPMAGRGGEDEDEDGEEVELMDLDGLTGGTTDLDEDMVEQAVAAASRQSSLAPSLPPTVTTKQTVKTNELPAKPIASLPAHDRRTVSASPSPEPQPSAEGSSSLFYIDTAPKPPKRTRQWVDPAVEAAEAARVAAEPKEDGEVAEEKDSLLLPSHVVVERPAPAGGDEVASGEGILTEAEVFAGELGAIEFLDGGDDRPASRYFDAQPEGGAAFGAGGKASMVCNICKQRGHVQRECTMQICLTCGAVDEHTTRSCPVALVCFACGGRGHRSRECPAPRSQQRHRGGGPMCDRCGSDVHPANNCPTLWRIYLYLTPPVRDETLTERQRLKELGGFEGDVLEADPDTEWGDGDGGWGGWCYNCSAEGHWGDDCPEPRTTRSNLQDFSAFSSYNAHNSPFFAGQPSGDYPSATSSSIRRPENSRRARNQRDGGMATPMRDLVVPAQIADVGKRGKERERERARKYESQRGDDDSWFDKARGGGDSGRDRHKSSKGKDRERDRDRDRGRYERDERDGGSGAGRKAGSRRDREARAEDEKKVDAFFSGGTGTDLEREYREIGGGGGLSIKGRAQGDRDPKDRGGSSYQHDHSSGGRAPGGSRSNQNQTAKPGFSFKFNSPVTASSSSKRDYGTSSNDGGSNTPISAIRPSLLSRMEGGSGPSSPSTSSRGSPASYDRSSSFERGGGSDGGDRARSERESDRRSKQSRSDRRDGERKDRDRKQDDAATRDRRNGGGDWLDSPDRREKTGGGGGSRYRGGYR